jgi:hypothetical protein
VIFGEEKVSGDLTELERDLFQFARDEKIFN